MVKGECLKDYIPGFYEFRRVYVSVSSLVQGAKIFVAIQ
jgi:hypothetical protein